MCSVQRCNYCEQNIDTDFNSEHFDCADQYECVEEEMENINEFTGNPRQEVKPEELKLNLNI